MMDNSKMKRIKLTGDMFIIPNDLMIMYNLFESSQEEMEELFKLNNVEFFGNSLIADLWVVIPEMSDNLACHGININGTEYCCCCNSIPFDIAKDLKEGETITLNFYGWESYMDHYTTIFELELTAKQLEYRYRRFGTWQEVCRALESCAA